MPATDTSIWDYVVTYGGPSLFMTAVFVGVMPLVWFKFARPRFARWPSRLAVMLAVWLLAWIVAYGDVLMIAREAKRVCEAEAGLRVYNRVTVDGFAGVSNYERWLDKGFKYIEEKQSDGTYIRHEKNEQGSRAVDTNTPRSEYEFAFEITSLSKHISLDRQIVRHIETGDVLTEKTDVRVYPGWLDSILLQLSGARFSPGQCSIKSESNSRGESHADVIDSALSPKSMNTELPLQQR